MSIQTYYDDKAAAEAAADFPTSNIATPTFFDYDPSRSEVTLSGVNVPASSPYKVVIPIPNQNETFTVTAGGNARTIVRPSVSPSASQVAFDPLTGELTFNSGDANEAISVTMTPLQSVISEGYLHNLQKNVDATQTEVRTKQGTTALLTSIIGVSAAADKALKFTGATSATVIDIGTTGESILAAGTASAARSTIGCPALEHGHTLADVTDAGSIASEDIDSVGANVIPDGDGTRGLGSSSNRWNINADLIKLASDGGNIENYGTGIDGTNGTWRVTTGLTTDSASGVAVIGGASNRFDAFLQDLDVAGPFAFTGTLTGTSTNGEFSYTDSGDPTVQVKGDGGRGSVTVQTANSNPTAILAFNSATGTDSSKGYIGDDDILASMPIRSWDDGDSIFRTAAYMLCRATQDHTDDNAGVDLEFGITPDNSRSSVLGFAVLGNGNILLASRSAPSSASDTGIAGEFTFDGSYAYYCTAANTWRRHAHATW